MRFVVCALFALLLIRVAWAQGLWSNECGLPCVGEPGTWLSVACQRPDRPVSDSPRAEHDSGHGAIDHFQQASLLSHRPVLKRRLRT
jgi:hypothetical protein